MNKTMRDLLAKMEAKQAEARTAKEAGDLEKAKGIIGEIDALKGEYEVEKALYEGEAATPPAATPADEKAADGFAAVTKMLRRQPMTDAEKALIFGGTSGENYLIPEDVRLAIIELRKQYKSAKNLLEVFPTDTMTGSFNFESGTPAGLTALTDGDDIDSTGQPTFVRKPFAIGLFAKLIPVSNILKGAERAGLMAYLNRWFVKNAIITENNKVFTMLKTGKTVKALVGWEALKSSINKDLDPDALHDAVIVTNQTGFDVLDSEKDSIGRPILKENPAEPTQKLFQGLRVEVFSDAQLPNVSNKAPIFYGSLKAGGYFIDKMSMEFAASEHFLFGKNQTALRVIEGFDVIQADNDAYIYGTLAPTPAAAG